MKKITKITLMPAFLAGFLTAVATLGAISCGILGSPKPQPVTSNNIVEAPAAMAIPPPEPAPTAPMPLGGSGTDGEVISWEAFSNNKSAYDLTTTKGGSIGKDKLQAMINAMPSGVSSVAFYFGKDASNNVFLMFLPAGSTAANSAFPLQSTSFCPNNCQ